MIITYMRFHRVSHFGKTKKVIYIGYIDTYIANSCTHSGVEIIFLKSQRNGIAKEIIRITKCNNMRFIGKSFSVVLTLG